MGWPAEAGHAQSARVVVEWSLATTRTPGVGGGHTLGYGSSPPRCVPGCRAVDSVGKSGRASQA